MTVIVVTVKRVAVILVTVTLLTVTVFLIPLVLREGCNRFYWRCLFSLVYIWWTRFLGVSGLKSGVSQYTIYNLTK